MRNKTSATVLEYEYGLWMETRRLFVSIIIGWTAFSWALIFSFTVYRCVCVSFGRLNGFENPSITHFIPANGSKQSACTVWYTRLMPVPSYNTMWMMEKRTMRIRSHLSPKSQEKLHEPPKSCHFVFVSHIPSERVWHNESKRIWHLTPTLYAFIWQSWSENRSPTSIIHVCWCLHFAVSSHFEGIRRMICLLGWCKGSSFSLSPPLAPSLSIWSNKAIFFMMNVCFFVCSQLIESGTNQPELDTIAKYYFDGQGKALRPMVGMLMARAINHHIHKDMR